MSDVMKSPCPSRPANSRGLTSLILSCLLTIWLFEPAYGLVINMTDVGPSPMSAEQLNAFLRAAAIWEDRFTDPVTVNINISFEPLNWGILGSTRVARTSHPYGNVRTALISDATGSREISTASSLPVGSLNITDINGNRPETWITMCTANAKALGLGTGVDTDYAAVPAGIDAEIRFATAFAESFDYNPDDGIDGAKYDFVGVAAHEIGHALGFFSLTDIQDNNPGRTLHPNTLDLFRFSETGGVHSLNTGIRRLANGSAEYYDIALTNVPFSHGVLDTTDPACETAQGTCQASHWSDDQGNLMDPSVSLGVALALESDDIHAMDYIGWNQKRFYLLYPPREVVIGWFWLHNLPEVPFFKGRFERFPPPPPSDVIPIPNETTLGLRAGFDFGYEGGLRSGLGYARFTERVRVVPQLIVPLEPVEGAEYVDPPGDPVKEIPQRLYDVFIQSDLKGIPFVFRSMCGDNGCPFDPTLGQTGGYRIPGIIDGEGDNSVGDVDARLTLLLLVPDELGQPDPEKNNVFLIAGDGDDSIIIYDPLGIGANEEPFCGDSNHPIPAADLDGNCIVDGRDFALFADEWLRCTAPVCP